MKKEIIAMLLGVVATEAASNFVLARGADGTAPVIVARGAAIALRLNFRDAPLHQVLDYLSEVAGFVINNQVDFRGTLDVWSGEPLGKEEAVKLLDAALKKQGCTVSCTGRILLIAKLESGRNADTDVNVGSDPASVEKSDQVATQIIPVRYANASQLSKNIAGLLPGSAVLSVDETANALVLVATKTNIRRMLKIVSALDSSLARVSFVRVWPLQHADAKQLATTLPQLFSSPGSGQSGAGTDSPDQNSGPPGVGGGGPPGFGSFGGGPDADANATSGASAKIVAVADEPSNSLIVSAAAGWMSEIAKVVQQIDQPVTDITELRIFRLRNADGAELAEQLSRLFPDTSKAGSEQSQADMQFAGPLGAEGQGGEPDAGATTDGTASSSRLKKHSQVLAVADPRTSSLLVSAPSTLMPEVTRLIEQLDADSARKELVKVYELRNVAPQELNQALQDLFNRNSTGRTSNNRNSLLGDNNPLIARQTKAQSTTTSASTQSENAGGSRGGTSGAGL